MGFITNKTVIKDIQKFLNENMEFDVLLGLDKGTFIKALNSLDENKIVYNHSLKSLTITSSFRIFNDSKDRLEWAMYALLIFMAVEDAFAIKNIYLQSEDFSGSALLIEDRRVKSVIDYKQKEIAAEEYLLALWKCAITRLRTEYEDNTFSDEDRKFFKILHMKISQYHEESKDYNFFINVLKSTKLEELDVALNKGYECVPSRMVEYLESFLF